jgi:patatin-like phospholipase/acyl hydrolase
MSTQQPKRKVQRMNTLMLGHKIKVLPHIPRLLAFDGGGVRGLSSLLIVEQLMQEIQRIREEEGDPTPDDKPPLPCEYFDLICGTSTGGLIAIMLGRLRMVCPS